VIDRKHYILLKICLLMPTSSLPQPIPGGAGRNQTGLAPGMIGRPPAAGKGWGLEQARRPNVVEHVQVPRGSVAQP